MTAKSPIGTCDPSQRPLRSSDVIGRDVSAYLNLHNKCWVVADKTGVLGYTDALVLRDVTSTVRRAGYERCRKEQQRNVHAFLNGTLVDAGTLHAKPEGAQRLSYNCLNGPPCFVYRDGPRAEECFVSAPLIVAHPNGRVWSSSAGALALEDEAEPPTVRRRSRGDVRGFANVEAMVFVAGAGAGFVAAPRLNAVVKARPLGRYVPPSAGAAVGAIGVAALARRLRMQHTAAAAAGLGVGLAVGTVVGARRPGGLLSEGTS